ncbi:hypothetical protein niasHT_005893 [Heterodera trifolii]|uniref:L-type lectin-like domain-containing protein n=1 Tax=Heterodera trifolii TaxID=157864 RepID=A0ABD2LXN0_9BILA
MCRNSSPPRVNSEFFRTIFLLSLLTLVHFLGLSSAQQDAIRRFEYKHSFRTPNLAQRDGTIPFWTVAGDAIASGEQLRLAPSMRSRKGLAWNKRAFTESDHFELQFAFKVTGQGRIGGDGLAIWYTAQQGTLGPVFGANDYWTGMAIMLDSFDNDGQRNNPAISLMINDGTRAFDHHTDGSNQVLSTCQRDFRNKQYPVHIKVEYFRNTLTVHVSDGMSATPRFEMCIRAEHIFLPKAGFFGVSAATGGLADDHDVLDFSLFSLFTDIAQLEHAKQQLATEERSRAQAEFERQQQEYEKERQKFKEQHPEKAKSDEEDDQAKYYEDAQQRELRLIYEAQANIHTTMQKMELQLNEIVHWQQKQQQHAGAVQQQGGGAAVPPAAGTFLAHEKNELILGVRELSATLREMKNYVTETYTRAYNIEQNVIQQQQQQQAQASGAGVGTAIHPNAAADQTVVRNYLELIQQEVRQIRSNQQMVAQQQQQNHQQNQQQQQQHHQYGTPNNSPTATTTSCVSSTMLITIILLQTVALGALIFIRSKSDKAKFY